MRPRAVVASAAAAIATAAAAIFAIVRIPLPELDRVHHGLRMYSSDFRAGVRAVRHDGADLVDSVVAGIGGALSTMDVPALIGAPGHLTIAGAVLAGFILGGAIAFLARRRSVTPPAPQLRRNARVRIERAREMAALHRPGADIARETLVSRDAIRLIARLTPRSDGIAASGRTFRADEGSGAGARARTGSFKLFSGNALPRRFGGRAAGTTVASP
jgi:hypothetical protein